MKVEKQLPAVATIDSRERRQTVLPDAPASVSRKAPANPVDTHRAERAAGKNANFNLQLNQQLSSMQSADSYLGELADRLAQLKLSLGRELSNSQPGAREAVKQAMQQAHSLLRQRAERSGNSLDASFKLRLNEPVRSRFSLEGLESIDAIRRAGKETLLFSGGRALAEPVAVVLDEDMSEQQILRRFNTSLGQAGIRAELDAGGAVKFSAKESDWQQLKGQLAVQGEGKLFAKGKPTRLDSHEDELLRLPADSSLDSFRELRRVLDDVVRALDKIASLREQLSHRQEEIREFLARQSHQDEKQWAQDYASLVFNLMRQSPSSYAAVTQTVIAQANINRFTVVSLLS